MGRSVVSYKFNDVLENLSTSIITAYYYSSLKTEAAGYFETSADFYQTRGRYIYLRRHCCKGIKPRKMYKVLFT
jgi:hypothetical protein